LFTVEGPALVDENSIGTSMELVVDGCNDVVAPVVMCSVVVSSRVVVFSVTVANVVTAVGVLCSVVVSSPVVVLVVFAVVVANVVGIL
jgi:hypothetical protein